MILNNFSEGERNTLHNLIPTQKIRMKDGIKYLGFHLKPDFYRKEHWSWLIRNIEANILIWVNRLLSQGGRLIVLKSILESIPVYWNSIMAIPKGVLQKICKICFQCLWVGKHLQGVLHLVHWSMIATLKEFDRWALKEIFLYAQALTGRNL